MGSPTNLTGLCLPPTPHYRLSVMNDLGLFSGYLGPEKASKRTVKAGLLCVSEATMRGSPVLNVS